MIEITTQRSSRFIGAKKSLFSALLILATVLFNVMVPILSAKSTLMSGESLKNGAYLDSPDGTKRFVIEGRKAIIQEKDIRDLQTWILTPENDQGAAPEQYRFRLDTFGLLTGVDANGQVTRWIRDGRGLEKVQGVGAWELSLRNNGLLYLKDPAGVIAWNNICDQFETFLESNNGLMGSCLVSPDYGSFLYMKKNGNLVLYKGYTTVYSWSNIHHSDDEPPATTFLRFSKTGTLKVLKYTTKEEQLVYDNDKPGVKEDKYRLTITNDAKMLIVDSSGNQVALLP